MNSRKIIYQTIHADTKQALRDELAALKAELAALTGQRQMAFAYAA